MKLFRILLLCCFFSGTAQDLNTYFKPVKFRNIGPFRGGRANAGTGVVGDPLTYIWASPGAGYGKRQTQDTIGKTFPTVILKPVL